MVVRPEYTAGRGRVDFALCEGSGSPKVFIEVKGLGGETEDAVEQVMQYAFRAGVRIVVLTDGGTWSVYLPAEEGSYEERRVFKLDLSEHSPQKSSEVLQRYLEESRVVSGEALKSALRDLGDRKRLEKARRAVPSAWRDIFEAAEPDESLNLLVDVLADRVESKVGVRPDDNDVVNFLRSLQRQEGQVLAPPLPGASERKQFVPHRVRQVSAPPLSGASERKQPVHRRVRQVSAPPSSGANGGGHSEMLVILGKSFPCKNPTDAMVTVFKELERRERGFWQRFYNDPRNHGRTRRIIAQDARGLYDSDNPRYAKAYKQLGGGWVIATYNGKLAIEKNIELAAEVAGLVFGKDIIVNFADSLQRQEEQGSPLPLSGASERKQPVHRRVRQVSAPPSSGTNGGGRSGELVILGKSFHYGEASEAMVIVFKELERRKPGFWQRFYKDGRNHGKTRRIIAQDPRELYDHAHLEKFHKQLGGNWVIATNHSRSAKKNIIRIAADVAGLEFGRDIIVNFDDSLQRQERQVSAPPPSGASERKQPVQRRVRRVSVPGRARGGRVKVVITGKESSWQDQSDAMATVFRELQKRDQNFYQRFYEHPRNHGKTRRIIAQDARELYDNSDNPHLKKAYRQLGGGWFISTSHSWPRKKEIIQLAADVAGLKLKFEEDISGKDIIVNLDDD